MKNFGVFLGKRKEKDIYLRVKGLKIKISEGRIYLVYVRKLDGVFEYKILEISEKLARILEDAIGRDKILEKEREIFRIRNHITSVDEINGNKFFVIKGENPERIAKELGLKEKFTKYFSEPK